MTKERFPIFARMKLPKSLQNKLQQREDQNALRKLPIANNLIDFSSNDYIGFAKSEAIFNQTHQYLIENKIIQNGAMGSRLLSGNHSLYNETEDFIAKFHKSADALIYNSGYDANVGFFSCVPQKGDLILYDEFCHASIRDGISLSNATSYKYKHNNLNYLEELIKKYHANFKEVYIVTESVFSMDGDSPDLEKLVQISEKHNSLIVIDEAHALGVFGLNGEGLVQHLNLQDKIFARIITFGKALGCHGAVVVGSKSLTSFLLNFSRSFIYTTALSPHTIATIYIAYQELKNSQDKIQKLYKNSLYFNSIESNSSYTSSIKSVILPGNQNVKNAAIFLNKKGFDVKPILSPTVPEGQERLRFCLHSYNTEKEISKVLELLSTFVFFNQ